MLQGARLPASTCRCSIYLGAALALYGCANYATLQTAETMPAGKFQVGVGATFARYGLETRTTTTASTNGQVTTTTARETEHFTVPALTLSGRYGLSDRFELHGVVWLPLGASLGGKYMLVGEPKKTGFFLSPGLDASLPLWVTVNNHSFVLLDVYVPLHMGYRTSPSFELYWTPKYVLRVLGTELSHAAGGTIGVAIGENTPFMLEGGVLYDSLSASLIPNAAIGVAFN
jgi:hypothetical protein